MNGNQLGVVGLVIVLSATPVFAGPWHESDADTYYDYARVINVDRVIRHVRVPTPRSECWEQDVQVPVEPAYRSATPVIVGGIIGGVVGSDIGNGRGRDLATIAGALLGGSVARDAAGRQGGGSAYTTTTETRCRSVNEYHDEQRVVGYRVTYRYHGRNFVTRTEHDPGSHLRLQVTAVPVT